MYMGRDVFQAYAPARAKALADYYRYARDNDLYLTYVIINPQADRSKAASEQADPYLTTGVVDEDAEGINRARRENAGNRRCRRQRGFRHLHPAAASRRRALMLCPLPFP